ncbi:hypothetical protein D9613_001505 [Agrocybe pediades]|uniref:Uncharacterized protein n=1 Tax=Agrocybe pediades TaxID=84607 RepID=A0A8H4VUQ2_9AGAR|nr:hypothetical protein D9613_001505 [Agrocybe pediades]
MQSTNSVPIKDASKPSTAGHGSSTSSNLPGCATGQNSSKNGDNNGSRDRHVIQQAWNEGPFPGDEVLGVMFRVDPESPFMKDVVATHNRLANVSNSATEGSSKLTKDIPDASKNSKASK